MVLNDLEGKKRTLSNRQFSAVLFAVAIFEFVATGFWREAQIFFILGATGFFSLFTTAFFLPFILLYRAKYKSWKYARHFLCLASIALGAWCSMIFGDRVRSKPNYYTKDLISNLEDYKVRNGRYPAEDFHWLQFSILGMEYSPTDDGNSFIISLSDLMFRGLIYDSERKLWSDNS